MSGIMKVSGLLRQIYRRKGQLEMNAEKYVNDIVRGIKCTGAKKKEIRNQLLSDIAMRREQGETIEQIVESMGSAQEIAEAFCQDLSDADQKAYRRKRIGVILGAVGVVLLLLLSLAAYIRWLLPMPAALSEDYTQEEISAEVQRVIELLDQNDFAALQEVSVDKIRGAMTQETIDKVRQGISDDWGSRQSFGRVYAQGAKQRGEYIIVTQTDVIYENISVVYTISFDRELRLAGLYMR